jgi:hypothetical protein
MGKIEGKAEKERTPGDRRRNSNSASAEIPEPSTTTVGQGRPEWTPSGPMDPELCRIIEGWPALSEPIRRAILALLNVAGR